MYKFKINQIKVNSIDGIQEIAPKRINIIVGPNNSGKSRLLKELRDYFAGDHRDLRILSTVDFPYPNNFDEINTAYNIGSKMVQDLYGNWMLKVYINKIAEMPKEDFKLTSTLYQFLDRIVNSQ